MISCLWNYYRDEVNDDANENIAVCIKINDSKTITTKSFKYKKKIIRKRPNDNNILHAEVVAPLKYLNNFWRFLGLPLVNCEIELDLPWSKKCLISEISIKPIIAGKPRANIPILAVAARQTTGATFQINNNKIYIPVVTFSINDNIKLLENIKQGFKRTISSNKYGSEVTTQTKKNNLDYLIDPTFRQINVLSFKNGNDDPRRHYFDQHYMPLVEIKDFNALINNKPFIWSLSKKTRRVRKT